MPCCAQLLVLWTVGLPCSEGEGGGAYLAGRGAVSAGAVSSGCATCTCWVCPPTTFCWFVCLIASENSVGQTPLSIAKQVCAVVGCVRPSPSCPCAVVLRGAVHRCAPRGAECGGGGGCLALVELLPVSVFLSNSPTLTLPPAVPRGRLWRGGVVIPPERPGPQRVPGAGAATDGAVPACGRAGGPGGGADAAATQGAVPRHPSRPCVHQAPWGRRPRLWAGSEGAIMIVAAPVYCQFGFVVVGFVLQADCACTTPHDPNPL